jgi:hypothetical protein
MFRKYCATVARNIFCASSTAQTASATIERHHDGNFQALFWQRWQFSWSGDFQPA